MPQGAAAYPVPMSERIVAGGGMSPGFDVRIGELSGRVYLDSANETGPTYVLLHGIGVSHRYLARLHRQLAEAGRVLSLDLPGFGGTPRPQQALSVEDYARFVAQVLAAGGVVRCVLVGHSMGAQFAIEIARQHPDLVSHAVLIGPVVDAKRRTVLRQGLALARDCPREPLPASAIVLADYILCGTRFVLTELPAMLAYPTEERIGGMVAPVLVVRGAADPIANSDWCRTLADRAEDGRLLEVAGSRHLVQYSAPERVSRAIAAFAGAPLPAAA